MQTSLVCFMLYQILDWSKLKAFAKEILAIAQIMGFVPEMMENIVGERRKCWPPFPQNALALSLSLSHFSECKGSNSDHNP